MYLGEDIQSSFALNGTGYEPETSGTIATTSIGQVVEVVEGIFELGYASPVVPLPLDRRAPTPTTCISALTVLLYFVSCLFVKPVFDEYYY